MNLLDFAKKVSELKDLKRTGWVQRGVRDPESVADHSFMLAILAYVYSKKLGLDSSKAVKLALIHDICEVYSGDIADKIRDEDQVVPNSKKRELEEQGLKKIVSFLPEDLAKEIYDLWEDFEYRKSKEAELVKDLDKLEMCMQALKYSEKHEDLEEFFEDGKLNIKTPEIKKVFEKIFKEFDSRG
ncbi:MAG: HD domain-containing protein [Candidatus Aenigmarchaeota archaeon]|nr:HD domain-containing protein [Candidatus Aenigmarchaeota archaeon]NIP40661.1 HD domain-containing protein [Candidatus Aenigmarchaeota archaeon]NIQ18467.1 HD domain-containing protein [Candidatus Aenigmarchaeota archaeon]NIS73366.1 HD domain-containing protein [Candidatus Aenigmarchaeota archaeon]